MSFIVIIPARLASSRLPEKLIKKIAGKTVLQHTFERAMASKAERIIIATDAKEIAQITRDFGAEVVMTGKDCNSGTERLAEVVSSQNLASEVLAVNLQGDEPLMPGQYINQVAEILDDDLEAEVATLAGPIKTFDELINPNVVKVVANKNDEAMYFSRSVIPANKTLNFSQDKLDDYLRHIGIYAYRAGFLSKYRSLGPCALELKESLEQLRVLHHGFKIKLGKVDKMPGPGIDSSEDFAAVEKIILVGGN